MSGIARNGKCPCGSGLKYKNCCLNKNTEDIIDDKNDEAYNYIEILNEGIIYKRQGKYQKAKEMYIKAIHIDNTYPNAYYNLGKILYILEEYDESAKAYRAAYERSICEIQISMMVESSRLDANNVFVHLGHSLLDKDNTNGKFDKSISTYRKGIDPIKKEIRNGSYLKTNNSMDEEYEKICIDAAKRYLE